MNDKPESNANESDLKPLADYLLGQRDAILAEWRERIEAEGETSVLIRASHEEFYDHLPEFLDRLHAAFQGDGASSAEGPAEMHGAQRWRLGMNIEETAHEWGHLHQVLIRQIAAYHDKDPSFGFDSLQEAYYLLAERIHEGIIGSIAGFHSRYRLEAEARMRDLEDASKQWDELEKRRGETLRQVSHDLRGRLSVIRLAAELLKTQGLDVDVTEVVEDMVSATENLNQILNDLLNLARLEAGQEQRETTAFDAAGLLRGLCDVMQPLARDKGLALLAEGDTPLPVRGDRSKVQRIAQNLILNALKYTEAGQVEVSWKSELPECWMFSVRDTGPGLPYSNAGALAQGLEEASQTTEDAKEDALPEQADVPGGAREPGPSVGKGHGEGIGLVIVRRLCELLDGIIEVESEPGQGTVFRIILPADYTEP